jgi:hypothetical protein
VPKTQDLWKAGRRRRIQYPTILENVLSYIFKSLKVGHQRVLSTMALKPIWSGLTECITKPDDEMESRLMTTFTIPRSDFFHSHGMYPSQDLWYRHDWSTYGLEETQTGAK